MLALTYFLSSLCVWCYRGNALWSLREFFMSLLHFFHYIVYNMLGQIQWSIVYFLSPSIQGFWPLSLPLHRLFAWVYPLNSAYSLTHILSKLGVIPQYQFWAAFDFIQCPLYVNSVMSNLNTRRFIRYGRRTQSSYELSSLRFNSNRPTTNGNEVVSWWYRS